MAVVPDPKKLLLPDPDYQPSYLSDKFIPIFSAVLGFAGTCMSRYTVRRPIFSGIQQHLLFSALGGAIGVVGQKNYDDWNARKDAMYRHYIELHPEDFPMPERKKIGELFPRWTPVR